MEPVTIVGGGLAGSEAAWQLATRGVRVRLCEMRPGKSSPAHSTGRLAELVCSNSLGAAAPTSPAGILKQELSMLDSLIIRAARASEVPAGRALAVDRDEFSSLVSGEIERHENIELIRAEITDIPEGPAIIATGPLSEGDIASRVAEIVGERFMSFFDASAPIVTLDSIDMGRAYRANRYGSEEGDYINCPMDRERYREFQIALAGAERAKLSDFDARPPYFEGCLPIEVMAERGADTMRFGPMRPVGLDDPSTGREPYALVQLRRDNAEGTLYNMVGFQTNLKWPEQERVFRMIPALERAEFARMGVMHRNSFVRAPRVLDWYMRPRRGSGAYRSDLFLAGQITGVEGYTESAASGAAVALFMYALLKNTEMRPFPDATAIGSLLRYLRSAEPKSFQPMNVNLGIFPPLPQGSAKRKKLPKGERSLLYGERSRRAMEEFLGEPPICRQGPKG
ncbi:MAG: methylenetetrahydrofolate--tRNA-(uracil(54)-C(5))-methyltransferase (FADH(2)-oxidizing) TrmFO [Synergistaceae bacterium]|jgi:methylenetetrahydrofolate--tRNA-(uracil-5-)-methyltransferase|nr:methylenetetrahydrofolate--tRNA-(uracil(54)-C(5))-methyltransferase (FADH(2)-oxidizing) TrmFO [Synergistaceae bacterium]